MRYVMLFSRFNQTRARFIGHDVNRGNAAFWYANRGSDVDRLFPAFFAHSLLVALIPAVSEAHAKNQEEQLQRLLTQSMQMTFLYGIPSIVAMYFFAEPLTNLFFILQKPCTI